MYLMSHKKNKQTGFTLIELLVVIGIIAVLTSISIVSYNTAAKKARDAKRLGDIKDIQNALEQYYAICGNSYPTPVSNRINAIICTNPSAGIMVTVPFDPQNTPYSCPTTLCTRNAYRLCAGGIEVGPTVCVTNKQ